MDAARAEEEGGNEKEGEDKAEEFEMPGEMVKGACLCGRKKKGQQQEEEQQQQHQQR